MKLQVFTFRSCKERRLTFDGTSWMIFDITNSVFFDNSIITITIDESGNKWIGTYFGLVKFNDTNWTVYNNFNSGLPENTVTSIAIDEFGNKWIGSTANGVSIYKEGGVVLSKKEARKKDKQKVISLFQNYPNPFKTATTIKFKVTEPGFISSKIFDGLGTEITMLVNEKRQRESIQLTGMLRVTRTAYTSANCKWIRIMR